MSEKAALSSEPSGVLVIDKPMGWTSFDVVGKLRKLYATGRIGHTGTLDPMATGVLVVLIGRAAKAAEYISCHDKTYLARMKLGLTTDTEDITGEILTRYDGPLPSDAAIRTAAGNFVGNINQVPPMYSALKVGGKKLCDLAREGKTIERDARPVTIYSLDCAATDRADEYVLGVECSSGTYIRTLCADIGAELGCGAVMSQLRRLSVGRFSLSDAIGLAEVERMSESERRDLLLPVERLFEDLPVFSLPPFFERLFRSGCEIYQKKLGTTFDIGKRVRVSDARGHFFALGEVCEFPNGSAVKSLKLFEL